MKIDTKKATPVKASPGCKVVENRFIRDSCGNDDYSKPNRQVPHLGRQIVFQANVILSPTMESARIQQNDSSKTARAKPKRFTPADLDDLCAGLSTMSLNLKTNQDKKVETNSVSKTTNEETEPVATATEADQVLGCITKTVRNVASGRLVTVRRSARLSN